VLVVRVLVVARWVTDSPSQQPARMGQEAQGGAVVVDVGAESLVLVGGEAAARCSLGVVATGGHGSDVVEARRSFCCHDAKTESSREEEEARGGGALVEIPGEGDGC
jgi:hypothetical protein